MFCFHKKRLTIQLWQAAIVSPNHAEWYPNGYKFIIIRPYDQVKPKPKFYFYGEKNEKNYFFRTGIDIFDYNYFLCWRWSKH